MSVAPLPPSPAVPASAGPRPDSSAAPRPARTDGPTLSARAHHRAERLQLLSTAGGLRMNRGGVTGEGRYAHEPVMVDEIVDLLTATPDGLVVDATVGGGGHAAALLAASPRLHLIGLDRDPAAVVGRPSAARRLRIAGAGRAGAALTVWPRPSPRRRPSEPVVAILFDLGVSSVQFDDGGRGFSYRFDAPLDMRMDPGTPRARRTSSTTGRRRSLPALMADNGEVRFSRRIARAIVANRPGRHRPAELAELVQSAIPAAARHRRGHPAKRVFQALRIAVNQELELLGPALDRAVAMLATERALRRPLVPLRRGQGGEGSIRAGRRRLVLLPASSSLRVRRRACRSSPQPGSSDAACRRGCPQPTLLERPAAGGRAPRDATCPPDVDRGTRPVPPAARRNQADSAEEALKGGVMATRGEAVIQIAPPGRTRRPGGRGARGQDGSGARRTRPAPSAGAQAATPGPGARLDLGPLRRVGAASRCRRPCRRRLGADPLRRLAGQGVDAAVRWHRTSSCSGAELEAPVRIETIAENQLYMVTPSSTSYLVPVKAGESVAEAHQNPTSAAAHRAGGPSLGGTRQEPPHRLRPVTPTLHSVSPAVPGRGRGSRQPDAGRRRRVRRPVDDAAPDAAPAQIHGRSSLAGGLRPALPGLVTRGPAHPRRPRRAGHPWRPGHPRRPECSCRALLDEGWSAAPPARTARGHARGRGPPPAPAGAGRRSSGLRGCSSERGARACQAGAAPTNAALSYSSWQ